MPRHVWIPLLLTILGTAGFAWLYNYYSGDTGRLSALGDFIGGAGSLLAIVWLTATVMQNTAQLRLQSEAIKDQQREAAHAGRHAALATIASTLETFDRNLLHNTDSSLRSVPDIFTRFVQSIDNDWPKIFEATERNQIVESFNRWLPVESAALKLTDLVATCGRFYATAVPDSGIQEYQDDAEYVAENNDALAKVPPLVPYISTAAQIAILLVETRNVMKGVRVRGSEALVGMSSSTPGFSARGIFRGMAKERADRFGRFLKE